MVIKILISVLIIVNVLSGQQKNTSQIETQNFVLENIDGDLIELNQFIGNGPILISFWATWCKPCKEELKEYNKLLKLYEDKGLTVLAISIDNEKSVAKVKPYVRTNGYDFNVLLDTNSEVARLYYAQAVPYSLIINNAGEVIYTHLGYKKGDELEVKKIIEELLNEKSES